MKKISLLLSIILLVVLVGCWSSVSTPKIEGVYQNEKILDSGKNLLEIVIEKISDKKYSLQYNEVTNFSWDKTDLSGKSIETFLSNKVTKKYQEFEIVSVKKNGDKLPITYTITINWLAPNKVIDLFANTLNNSANSGDNSNNVQSKDEKSGLNTFEFISKSQDNEQDEIAIFYRNLKKVN